MDQRNMIDQRGTCSSINHSYHCHYKVYKRPEYKKEINTILLKERKMIEYYSCIVIDQFTLFSD